MAVRMKSGALNTSGSDRWYVTDGANAVGPVKLELLTRGIEGGRVPLDSFVRHEAWKVWRPLTDFTDRVEDVGPPPSNDNGPITPRLTDAPLPQYPLSERGLASLSEERRQSKPPSLADFASAEGVPSRASSTVPPPRSSATNATAQPTWAIDDDLASDPGEPLSLSSADAIFDLSNDLLGDDQLELRPPFAGNASPEVFEPTDDIPDSADGKRGWGQARPAESTDALPDDDLRGAADLSDALLLLLGGAVKRTGADVALLHRMDDRGAVVACAHGLIVGVDDEQVNPLGQHVGFSDPIVGAALAGHMVVAEPSPGSAGSAMLRRLAPNGLHEALEATGPHLLLPGEPMIACRPVIAALMLPIMVRGRCFGFVELGKSAPFTAREIMKGDDLVRAFTRLVVDGALRI